MARYPLGLRARALQKIAELSTTSAPHDDTPSSLDRLSGTLSASRHRTSKLSESSQVSTNGQSLAGAPMSVDELHVLLALCKASSYITKTEDAEHLFDQLSPYILEAHEQMMHPSPFLQAIEPSPWEALTNGLSKAILILGINHPSLAGRAEDSIFRYIENCIDVVQSVAANGVQENGDVGDNRHRRPLNIVVLSLSILGFLRAISELAHFFGPETRLTLVKQTQQLRSEEFMVAIEGALSSLRNADSGTRPPKDQQYLADRYAKSGRPLGAMILQQAFMAFLVSCGSLMIISPSDLQQSNVLDVLMPPNPMVSVSGTDDQVSMVEMLSSIAAETLRVLDDGSDYLELSSPWQQRLALEVRGHAFTTFLTCVIVEEEIVDVDLLMSWLDNAMSDGAQMADPDLASIVFKCFAILARTTPAVATSLSQLLPRFIVQRGNNPQSVEVAAHCFATILQNLSQDAIITSLYSMGNVLSARSSEKGNLATQHANGVAGTRNQPRYTQHLGFSAISLEPAGDDDPADVYANVIKAIITIATLCEDKKIIPLAQSMLLQKLKRINPTVDSFIIIETAALGAVSEQAELKSLLKLYDRLGHDAVMNEDHVQMEAVRKARTRLAATISRDTPASQTYLLHLLETIVGKGDVRERHEKHDQQMVDVELAAEEISQLLLPLSILAPHFSKYKVTTGEENLEALQREVWFNLAVHGIIPESELWGKHLPELKIIAKHTRPLVAEDRTDHLESDIELNTVLRRGMSGPRTAEMKKRLISFLPGSEANIRPLPYPKVIFLHAAHCVESLRAEAGACADVLTYFIDPSVNQDDTSKCMDSIAIKVLDIFLKSSQRRLQRASVASSVSNQLAQILTLCCHRIAQCQTMAFGFANNLIAQVPSALCQKASLYTLLELLSLMWSSCLEAEIDEYEWKSLYRSDLANVKLELSDDYAFRRATLKAFHQRAKAWVLQVINIAPLDVKGLLQTYLSEYDDEGAYGHIALGRSFAVELGSAIPFSDQRLGAINRHDERDFNTASDFVAQYTTRQEYKHAEALPEYDRDLSKISRLRTDNKSHQEQGASSSGDARAILAVLDHRATDVKYVSFGELRDLSRRAAALVCRSLEDRSAIINHLVSIPFSLLSKQSLRLGISLWLAVINENPPMESRVLIEITKNWEESVQKKQGIFSDKSSHLDPFFLNEEYAPSDRKSITRRQQAASNIIGPHLRVLQFLSSHLEAYRLGSPNLRKSYQRMVNVTLEGLKLSAGHPLAREFHFHVVLFSLKVLKYSTDLAYSLRWRVKDRILSAALAWFTHSPMFSFGGNRLQVKAECQLLLDVETALNNVSTIGSNGNSVLPSLSAKHDLLLRLIEHEHMRLQVWLYPSSPEPKNLFPRRHGDKHPLENIPTSALKVAWAENPSLALQIAVRAQSPSVTREVRWKLLTHPENYIDESEAIHIMFEDKDRHHEDIAFPQLKYLLYWKPINPISAVTYFCPSPYQHHPFIVQYAMRALESHSVDVTFFYVPQIVQTLRFDSLGYVQRYIIETAKVSQLFAHQIIWNMKANAYKDEDSTVEDEIKPKLDEVMQNMIGSFSSTDKAFYEKEFDFFNEVTGISGKLRPYIKKEKSEKKQKIEEELRKIKVEIGVYLPSNPDGVVIGIDRKSGKPLQSHAKAPYMATFRIRKNKSEVEDLETNMDNTTSNNQSLRRGTSSQDTIYDVWQSAIFKVGDDCRQDVLALQMIAAFRNIFNDVGLDVWVYPYRVTATAPGCGVIDVLPNSISRDMLGREAVNGLYDYFVSIYGGEDSIRFQEARNNFVKSMASYSVISYLLQFKDRHNGNIMIDDAGHIIHIDFGFCFDIAPGGVKFERAPFKLTSEMVAVMGGSTNSQSYKWFEELCIKAFIASRPYAEKLSHLVKAMVESGLPCFVPTTIANFKDRFRLELSERAAAQYMKDIVKKSHNSYSTKGYDQFQLLTNGIPY